ncbi:MAG: DNA topoisomerase VI subunit B [Candidatus Methanosuratus sp.]|nr:DNA topoisomerase VI subunit B [Candidatus Methanosuratincola sp.]
MAICQVRVCCLVDVAPEVGPQGKAHKRVSSSGKTSPKKQKHAKPVHRELLTVAEAEARKMRAVNPAQYYRQNLGQLGFGDPEHALVQTIKELMDNSLDACEAMGVLPEVTVELTATAKKYEVVTNKTKDGGVRAFPVFRLAVEDNGCGVLKGKVAKCFGSVLYGSKFFSFKQSRGQQGLGVHAAIIYAQLTSLEPAVITTKIESDPKAYRVVLKIDTERNSPVVVSSEEVDFPRSHGTRVELMIAGDYTQKVESFIKELSLANPHADLKFTVVAQAGQEPKELHFKRANEILPPPPKEIKPHLLSMEPGALLEMKSNDACCATAKQFLVRHFVRISDAKAEDLLKAAGLSPTSSPKEIDVEALLKAAREGDLMRPPLDVLSPIGEDALRQSIRRIYSDAEFICTASREPWSYRGVPFQIEVGAAYGGKSVIGDCERVKEGVFKSRVIRLANKCPLIYDSRDCLLYKVVKEINWKNYKLPQDEGNLPMAPIVIIISLVSTKVPYSVPGKFAVAYHEEIREQLRLALQSLGRLIQGYISHRQRQEHEQHRQSIFQIYAREIARDMSVLTGQDQELIYNRLMASVKTKKQKARAIRAHGSGTPSTQTPATDAIRSLAGDPAEIPVEIPVQKPKKQQFTLEEYLR